ncbi:MAG: hypothetical protein AB1714_14195 [Acidobacteriota bacterium]
MGLPIPIPDPGLSSIEDGHFEIYTAECDGRAPRQVSRDGSDAQDAAAAPNGRWIVCNSNQRERRGLWRIKGDGRGAVLLHSDWVIADISADSRHVAFQVYGAGRAWGTVRIADVDTGKLMPFEILTGARIEPRPRWLSTLDARRGQSGPAWFIGLRPRLARIMQHVLLSCEWAGARRGEPTREG